MPRADGAPTARLFFALWPDARVREALASLARDAHAECGGRAVAADKVHITLFFLGNVERSRIALLKGAARALHGRAFALEFDRLDYWRHNRIVYVAARKCPESLRDLVAMLTNALTEVGFEKEDRPYVPHVTLLRNAKRGPKSAVLKPIQWSLSEFVLVESVQEHGAARYDVIASWPLLV